MKTITKNIYQFGELSDEAKKKAVKNYLDDLEDYYFLRGDMRYKAEELLKENNIEVIGDLKVYYSLSHSQGDGAMIEGEFEWKGWNVKVKQSGRYYHEYSKQITLTKGDVEITFSKDFTYKQFDDIYVAMCKELESYGYDCIKTFEEFDNIADILISNDYWYTIDGEMFSELVE